MPIIPSPALLAATVIKPALSVFSRPTDFRLPESSGNGWNGLYGRLSAKTARQPPSNHRAVTGKWSGSIHDGNVCFPVSGHDRPDSGGFTLSVHDGSFCVAGCRIFASSSSVPGVTTMIFSASAVSAALIRASIVHFA